MTNTIYLLVFLLSLTLSSCGGGEHSTIDTGSASFGLTFEEAPSAMKLAPSMAPAADICSSYGIDSISGTIYNSSNSVIATGGPWACSAHTGTIYNIPPGSNLRITITGTVSGTVVWQGETTGATIYAGQDTNVGSISMTYIGNDTIRPTVSAATPTGATVPLTSPITVTFSKAMASSTIDTTTFTLKNGSVAVPGSVSYNSTTKTATFTPTSSLSNSVIYTATVTTDVTDMAANKMQSLYTWNFTTEAPPGSAPSAPTGVGATAADKQVTISWTAVTGATSYNIYWSTTSGVTKSNGTKITGATSPCIHTALTNGTTYYYIVTAVNIGGESTASSQTSATPQVPVSGAPTGVSATAGDGQVTISWSTVTEATSYKVYWSTTSGSGTGGTVIAVGNVTSYTHTGLTNGTSYYYVVTAVNAGGESTASAQVSAMPSDTTAPANTTAVNFIDGGAALTNSTSVTLGISATDAVGVTAYYTSETSTAPSASASGWTAITSTSSYSASVSFTLSSGDVTKTVYVWFKDAAGNVSAAVSDSIALNANTTLIGGSIQGSPLNLTNAVTTLATGFNYPMGITTDGTNLFVADTANHTIRKIVISTGVVTTIAGSAGLTGSTDGTGTAARFNNPEVITTDGTNLYVTDSWNHTIRKIVISTGEVTTIAGSAGSYGSIDATGTSARFYYPWGITTDGTNLYVVDGANKTIRKIIISTGVVTTIAGSAGLIGSTDGTGTAARFTNPHGITTDGTNLFVADNSTIRKIIISTGVVTTIAGSAGLTGSTDGTGTAARFSEPTGITTDGTNLYVADYGNHTIRKIVISTVVVTTIAGTAGSSGSINGTGTAAKFNYPRAITTDGANLYVTDSWNHTIRGIQ